MPATITSGRALDAVRERFAAAVKIVELRFRDRVVHVDGGNQQLAGFQHLVEAMHAGGGFFAKRRSNPSPASCQRAGCSFCTSLEQILDDLFFVAAARRVHPVAAVFEFVAFVDQQRGVAAVIDDELRALPPG